MSSILETKSNLINTSMKFSSTAGEKEEQLITDYIPPFGEGKNFMPLELFLISLSTCLGGAISLLIKKKGLEVGSLSINAQGQRRETHPMCFEKISIDVSLVSSNAAVEDLQDAIKLSEEKLCPVYAMIDKSIIVVFKNLTVSKE